MDDWTAALNTLKQVEKASSAGAVSTRDSPAAKAAMKRNPVFVRKATIIDNMLRRNASGRSTGFNSTGNRVANDDGKKIFYFAKSEDQDSVPASPSVASANAAIKRNEMLGTPNRNFNQFSFCDSVNDRNGVETVRDACIGVNTYRILKAAQRHKIKPIPKEDVRMPTGRIVAFPEPAPSTCSCVKLSPTKRISLDLQDDQYSRIIEEMILTLKSHRSGSYSGYKIKSIQKVQNCCLWLRFKNRQLDMAKEECKWNLRMLFHGSAACDDIIKTGFDERHSNQSGMFGAGVYFAEHSSKSNQYVFGYMGGNGCKLHSNANCSTCERKMLLCRVLLGNMKELTTANKMSHAPPGFHSVAGKPSGLPGGLLYPEYIIYRGDQAYPEYEITYTIVP